MTSTYTCVECGTVKPLLKKTNTAANRFCSYTCQGSFRRKESIQRFLRGEVKERFTIRKCLSQTVGYHCSVCGISEWQDKPITLTVDHIDGDASNNFPPNLRLICPNCHSQTDTFGGRNKGKGRKTRGLELK